jgi:hypothetical protein
LGTFIVVSALYYQNLAKKDGKHGDKRSSKAGAAGGGAGAAAAAGTDEEHAEARPLLATGAAVSVKS